MNLYHANYLNSDIPSAVQNVSTSEISSRQAHIQWSPPNSANLPILHFTVHTTLQSGEMIFMKMLISRGTITDPRQINTSHDKP